MQKPSLLYMLVLIGGICSGKSTVSKYLASKGAYRIDLDACAHEVLRSDDACKEQLVDHFGTDILDNTGHISRSRLAARAFSSARTSAELERITHPAIFRLVELQMTQIAEHVVSASASAPAPASAAPVPASTTQTPALVVVELPLPDKAPALLTIADETMCVVASRAQRTRLARKRSITAPELSARMRLQPDDAAYKAYASYCIENEGSMPELVEKVDEWLCARVRSHAFVLANKEGACESSALL